jgi:predicted dehydrogenase
MARWCIGEISEVNAKLPTHIKRPGVDGQPFDSANDDALLSLNFKDGGQGIIHASAIAHLGSRGQQFQIILYGQEGTIEVDCNMSEGYVIRGAKNDEDRIRPLKIPDTILHGVEPTSPIFEQFPKLFRNQPIGTRLFIDAILNDLNLSPNFKDGLEAQKVIDAAMESDQKGCWVSV